MRFVDFWNLSKPTKFLKNLKHPQKSNRIEAVHDRGLDSGISTITFFLVFFFPVRDQNSNFGPSFWQKYRDFGLFLSIFHFFELKIHFLDTKIHFLTSKTRFLHFSEKVGVFRKARDLGRFENKGILCYILGTKLGATWGIAILRVFTLYFV